MSNYPKHFKKKDLPFNNKMKTSWNEDGFLIIDNFYSINECDELISRANFLVHNFDYNKNKSIFNTKKQQHVDDSYFLESGDKIRFFFEENSFDKNGKLTNNIELLINKIGHAMHDIDPIFKKFSHRNDLNDIAKGLKIKNPLLIQSMYIFKQPKIGGEVVCHQDSTFLYTIPESVVGFWIALEDANKENGCMWAKKGGHKEPLRKLFRKVNDKMIMKELNKQPFTKMDTPLEVNKGSLILLHGKLPHYSGQNKSKYSRHAYTLHVIDGTCEYPAYNWLQRNSKLPLSGFVN